MNFSEIIEQLAFCHYECEAGALENNVAWGELISLIDPKIQLVQRLKAIIINDTDYTLRNPLILEAMYFAQMLGYPTGFRIDLEEPEWPIAFIELPTGQVSWHVPQHAKSWDGHSTEEKMARVSRFIN